MKILAVGDPHSKISNIKDMKKLMDFILKISHKRKIKNITFLGDLFDTHSIKRVEVEDFWSKTFDEIMKSEINCNILVGNHDMCGSKEKEQIMNSLNVFKPYEHGNYSASRVIINKPMIIDNIAYIPYMSDKEAFIKAANDLYKQGATKLLIAHQTFTGATYENGFYAEDGIDPALVPQEAISSGHIHKQQQIGKCWYQGTPKWDTMSDANEDKGIWIYNHNKDGSIIDKEFISTKDIVTPIYKHIVNEGDEEPKLVKNARNYIEFVGKIAWINKMKKKFKNKAQIKARPTDRKHVALNKDILNSIGGFLNKHFEPIDGVEKKDINNLLEVLNETT